MVCRKGCAGMFLIYVYFLSSQSIMEGILRFIQDNSTLVEVVVLVITASLWLRKFLMQKRAEAYLGFYARLLIQIRSLREMLDEDEQLNIEDPEMGNIYSMIYVESDIKRLCPGYKHITDHNGRKQKYMAAAKELRETLLNTETNVYPSRATKDKWYESQFVLFGFCEFLENESYRGTIKAEPGETNSIHIEKCKALIEAMDFIQSSIQSVKY